MATSRPPDWKSVETATDIYRYVKHASKDDEGFAESFWSDRKAGKRPYPREKEHDELRDGFSAFISDEAARDQWEEIEMAKNPVGLPRKPLQMGDFIARVRVPGGQGFAIDLDPDGHLILKGDLERLVDAEIDIYPAARNPS
jgi:hypothetical protein